MAASSKRRGVGAALMRQAGVWLAGRHPDLGVYLWVLEGSAAARPFYERIGARDAGVCVMETHGGAIVRRCRDVWDDVASLPGAGARPGGRPGS